MLLINNIYKMSLIADFLLIIIIFSGFLYAINNKTKSKTIINKNEENDENDEDNKNEENDKDDENDEDNKNEENEQFKSDWIAIIKERIEYENKLSKEELNKMCNKINWTNISSSSNPIAIKLLQEYPENINWNGLCSNEHQYAIELIKKYPGKIHWSIICTNKNPDVIPLIKERIELEKSLITQDNYINYPNKISWENLVNNENAHELIIDRIEYEKKYWVNWMDNVKARYSMKVIEKIRIKDKKSLIIFKHVRDLDNYAWNLMADTIITHL